MSYIVWSGSPTLSIHSVTHLRLDESCIVPFFAIIIQSLPHNMTTLTIWWQLSSLLANPQIPSTGLKKTWYDNKPEYSFSQLHKKSVLTWFSISTNVVVFRQDSVCMGTTLMRERLQLRWVMIFENWSFPVSTQIFQIIFLHELSQNVNHNRVNKWSQLKIHVRYMDAPSCLFDGESTLILMPWIQCQFT